MKFWAIHFFLFLSFCFAFNLTERERCKTRCRVGRGLQYVLKKLGLICIDDKLFRLQLERRHKLKQQAKWREP
jgi:hypothetical protein